MRFYLTIFLLLGVVYFTQAQRPPLDSTIYKGWPKVEKGKISGDGKYIGYEVNTHNYMISSGSETIIQAVTGSWKKSFPYKANFEFSEDGRSCFVMLPPDTLMILFNGTENVSYVNDVSSFRVADRWLIYTKKNADNVLYIAQYPYNVVKTLSAKSDYQFDKKEKTLLLQQQDHDGKMKLVWYSLPKEKEMESFNFNGSAPTNWYYDQRLKKLVFTTGNGNNTEVWIQPANESQAIKLAVVPEKVIAFRQFSDDGSRLFFVTDISKPEPKPAFKASTTSNVSVWSWQDIRMEDQWGGRRDEEAFYTVSIADKKLVKVAGENQEVGATSNEYAIVREFSGSGSFDEEEWNPGSKMQNVLVSLKDGSRKKLEIDSRYPGLSRTGKYILYYDNKLMDYFAYDVFSGVKTNITQHINSGIGNDKEFRGYEMSYWTKNDESIIFFAKHDIWKVDLVGKKTAVNLTNGFGNRHGIFFNFVFDISDELLADKKGVLLCGFNIKSKDNGFFRMYPGKQADPEKLMMGDYYYFCRGIGVENGFDNLPLKAANADVWLLRRMKEDLSPNYVVTKDFKTFEPVSDVYPERKFNWYTTELYTFNSLEGESIQGILYKPQDFDAQKKYPIIFHYYQEFSNNLNAYQDPTPSIGPMNVPWMVSRGYLVFIPDIRHKPGKTGESAYNVVEAAANYMSKLPFVDASRMGLQGHSFGGYQTNYIITHSKLFAAACSSSGPSDLVSGSGELDAYNKPNHHMINRGQMGMHATFWGDRDRYIKNSPVFWLDKVTTPLLMMATTDDKAVRFNQALEMFNGMRVLQKKVWMLIYPEEDHVLLKAENYQDFTIRMTAFFDHYLMGKPMPDWMKSFRQ